MKRHEVLGLVDILIPTKHHQVANLEPKMRTASHYSFPLFLKSNKKVKHNLDGMKTNTITKLTNNNNYKSVGLA